MGQNSKHTKGYIMKNLSSTSVLQLPSSSLEANNTISFFILPEMFDAIYIQVRRKKKLKQTLFINWGGVQNFQKYRAISYYLLIFIESPWQPQTNLSLSIIGDIKIVSPVRDFKKYSNVRLLEFPLSGLYVCGVCSRLEFRYVCETPLLLFIFQYGPCQ